MKLPLSDLVFAYNDRETILLGLLADGKGTSFTGIQCQNARNKVNASAEFLCLEETGHFSPNKAKMEQKKSSAKYL